MAAFPLAYLLIGYVIWSSSSYFFEIIEHKAMGGDDWPVLSLETIAGRRYQLGFVFVLLLALAALVCWTADALLGRSAAVAVLVVVLALVPASLSMLALTRNPIRAANPALLLQAAVAMRGAYVVACGVGAASFAAGWFALSRLGFLEAMGATYLFFVFGYLLGAFAYRHRLALGVHAPRAPEERAARESARVEQERHRVLDHAYGLASRGNVRGALAYLERYIETEVAEPERLAVRAWVFNEMTRWDNPGPALDFGRDLVARLGDSMPALTAKLGLSCAALEEAVRRHSVETQ
jgi:hypothetical protein